MQAPEGNGVKNHVGGNALSFSSGFSSKPSKKYALQVF